jgi:hypothetical protein
MTPAFEKHDFKLHAIGKELQRDLPYYEGLGLRQLEAASGLSYFTVYLSIERLEKRGKASSVKDENGRRKKDTIRFKGRMPIRKSN